MVVMSTAHSSRSKDEKLREAKVAAAAETVEVLEVLATADDVKFEEEAETVADVVGECCFRVLDCVTWIDGLFSEPD